MSIDTDSSYKVPQEYQPKNKDFEPKMKPASVFMIILGVILVIALIAAIITGAIFGISKIIENIH